MTDIKRSQVGQKHVLIAVKQLGLGIKVFFFKSFKVFNYTTWKMHLRLLNVGIRMDHSICDLHLRSIVRSIVFFFEWHISLHNFQYRKIFSFTVPISLKCQFSLPTGKLHSPTPFVVQVQATIAGQLIGCIKKNTWLAFKLFLACSLVRDLQPNSSRVAVFICIGASPVLNTEKNSI